MRINLAALALLCASCAARPHDIDHADPEFRCEDRRAAYEAAGTLAGARQGVRLVCDGNQPVVERYSVNDEGTERSDRGTIAVAVWERAWAAFQNAGWRNLGDCDNPGAGEREPRYSFEVGDGEIRATFSCIGNELPFPYDSLQRALDLAAGELPSGEIGD